uniref:Uncharacterized protein n=1 Tax=Kalanchoe fedtschenkoi TaxID=63787 RepID=A0A7N0TDT6_KALFE
MSVWKESESDHIVNGLLCCEVNGVHIVFNLNSEITARSESSLLPAPSSVWHSFPVCPIPASPPNLVMISL